MSDQPEGADAPTPVTATPPDAQPPGAQPPAAGGHAGPDPAPAQRVELASISIWQVIGAILLTLAGIELAQRASGLIWMVAISFFFSLALEPAVRRLHARYGWRRGACVGVVYGAGILFLVFMFLFLVPAIAELADRVAENGSEWFAELNAWASDTLGVPLSIEATAESSEAAGASIRSFAEGGVSAALGVASAGIGLVFNLATIAMFTFYLSAEAPAVQRSILRLFSPRAQNRIGWAWDQAIVQTGGYFYSRLILMVINGIGFFATMAIVGMPIALALGLAVIGAFISVFIPAVGTYIGAAIPIAITLAITGLGGALVLLGYVLVYQQLENYWLSPRISANTMSLNGGIAFGAALAGGAIAGPMGAFVALPVAALISSMITNWARSHEVVYSSRWDAASEGGEAAAEPATAADAGT